MNQRYKKIKLYKREKRLSKETQILITKIFNEDTERLLNICYREIIDEEMRKRNEC